jgi:hypothetical protein
MAEVVRAALVDPGCFKRRIPTPLAPVVKLDPSALRSREYERCIQAGRQLIERVDRADAQRHPPP